MVNAIEQSKIDFLEFVEEYKKITKTEPSETLIFMMETAFKSGFVSAMGYCTKSIETLKNITL